MKISIDYEPSAKQLLFHSSDADEILYGGAAGGGKATSLDTPIPTPTGWTTMGEIKRGDTVFGADGKPCEVVSTSPVMFGHKVYELEFSDGSTIKADAEHLWYTETASDRMSMHRRTEAFRLRRRATRRRRGTGRRPDLANMNTENPTPCKGEVKPRTKTTQEIADTLNIGVRTNHSIPVCGAIQTAEKELLVPPYVLGAWLGDGSRQHGMLAGIDDEVFDEVANNGYTVTKYKTPYARGVLGLITQLKKIGVYMNKHIPREYLRASIDQRKELLMGLMDTDGSCDTRGQCEFYNTNKRLIDDTYELICSLGIKAVIRTGRAKLYGKDCGEKYRIKFLVDFPAFKLPRKLERQKMDSFRGTHRRRYIVNVRKAESVPVKCITVDSSDHLYLVGRSFIPTHNSKAVVMDALFQALKYPGCQPYIFRRTYKELEDTIINEMYKSYPAGIGEYNNGRHEWRAKNGSVVRFRHCQRETDIYDYQGSEIHFLYIDELTHWTRKMVEFLSTRLRAVKELGLTPKKKFTSNPGGIGHAWVKKDYVKGYLPNEIKTFETYSPTLNKNTKITRQFIPAFVQDNPHLGDEYITELERKPDALRKALLLGDWDVFEGQVFTEWTNDKNHYGDHLWTHVIDPFPIPHSWRIYRSFDWGYATPFSVLWWTIDQDGILYLIREWYGSAQNDDEQGLRMEPAEVAKGILERENKWFDWKPHITGFADPSVFSGTIGESPADLMKKAGVRFKDPRYNKYIRQLNERIPGKMQYHARLRFNDDGRPGMQVFNTCRRFIEHIPALVYSQTDPEDVDTRQDDHDYDAGRYMLMAHKHAAKKPTILKPRKWNPLA